MYSIVNTLKSRDIKTTLEHVEVQEFKEGDHVRATMTSLYSEQRKIAKKGKSLHPNAQEVGIFRKFQRKLMYFPFT